MLSEYAHELTEAWQAFEWKEYDRCIVAAEPFLNSPDTDLQRGANTLIGLSYARKKDYQVSLPFLERSARIRDDAIDWLYVTLSATWVRDFGKGNMAFQHALARCLQKKNTKTNENYIRLDYANALADVGEFKLALDQVNWLRQIYLHNAITDETFLVLRGIPPLRDVARLVVRIFRGQSDISNGKEWILSLAASVDGEGKETLERFLGELEQIR